MKIKLFFMFFMFFMFFITSQCLSQIVFEHIGTSDKFIPTIIINKKMKTKWKHNSWNEIISLNKKDFILLKEYIRKYKKNTLFDSESEGYPFFSFKIQTLKGRKDHSYVLYNAEESKFFFKELIIFLNKNPNYNGLLKEVSNILLRAG